MTGEYLFESAFNALVFAFNYAHQQSPDSPMRNLGKTPGREGKGLNGLDGAAQAGMIRAELSRVSGYGEYALIARVAPKSLTCGCGKTCCAGRKPNAEWTHAIDALSVQMLRVLSGGVSNYRLRRGCVEKYFGSPVKIGKLADYCGVHRDTAGAHNVKIVAALKKTEATAWREIDELLKKSGITG